MEQVALLKCEQYDVSLIENKIREGFDLLGGEKYIRELIPINSKVLLKPNLLSAEKPGSIVVTDYRVFEAVIRVLKDYAGEISFGDSPGFGGSLNAAEACGLIAVADKYGVKFEDFDDWEMKSLSNHLLVPAFEVAKAPMQADVLITLPRLKTHGMTSYTGAIKNQFGCVPGLKKANWHSRMPRAKDFSRMLLDLNSLVDTSFAILDGIVAMEGNGPKNGNPKKMETLIMGRSISAVDSLAATLIGYNPMDIPYLNEAYKNNWGPVLQSDIEVLGESINEMMPQDFDLVRGKGNMSFSENTILSGLLKKLIAPKPTLLPDLCISCKKCAEICPETPKVIEFPNTKKPKPTWNYPDCMRCFCCQEICPVGAIVIEYPKLAKFLKMDK